MRSFLVVFVVALLAGPCADPPPPIVPVPVDDFLCEAVYEECYRAGYARGAECRDWQTLQVYAQTRCAYDLACRNCCMAGIGQGWQDGLDCPGL